MCYLKEIQLYFFSILLENYGAGLIKINLNQKIQFINVYFVLQKWVFSFYFDWKIKYSNFKITCKKLQINKLLKNINKLIIIIKVFLIFERY